MHGYSSYKHRFIIPGSLGKTHRWIFLCEIVHHKVISSLGVSNEIFLTANYY